MALCQGPSAQGVISAGTIGPLSFPRLMPLDQDRRDAHPRGRRPHDRHLRPTGGSRDGGDYCPCQRSSWHVRRDAFARDVGRRISALDSSLLRGHGAILSCLRGSWGEQPGLPRSCRHRLDARHSAKVMPAKTRLAFAGRSRPILPQPAGRSSCSLIFSYFTKGYMLSTPAPRRCLSVPQSRQYPKNGV